MMSWFDGNVMRKPGKVGVIYNEGPAVIQETIEFLRDQKPLGAVEYEPIMQNIVDSHA